MHDRSTRRFIWVSLVVQLVGYVYDAVWHGLLNPGFEPATRDGQPIECRLRTRS